MPGEVQILPSSMQKQLSVIVSTGDMLSEMLKNDFSVQIRIHVSCVTRLRTIQKTKQDI